MAELRDLQFRPHFRKNARIINQLFVGITEKKKKMSRATFEGSGNRPLITKKNPKNTPKPSTTSDPDRLPSQKNQSALNALMGYGSDSDEEEGGGGVVSNFLMGSNAEGASTAGLSVVNNSAPSIQHVVESGDKTASHGRPQQFQRISGKRKRGSQEDILIDANVDDYLDRSQLIKGISEESAYQPHRRKNNLPSSQQRRKNQITYLAFQAKERELELKNQWSWNRMIRNQSRAKYGF